MARFFIRHRGEPERGPLRYVEILRLIEVGGITRATELRGEGRNSWHKAGDVAGLADALQAAEARLPRDEPVESVPPLAPTTPPEAPTPPRPFTADVTPPPERRPSPPPEPEWDAPETLTACDAPSATHFDASPPPTIPHAARPLPVGIGDRILRVAFGFGKGFSVFALLVAILAVVGSIGLGVYALMPNPLPTSLGVTSPEATEFIAACQTPSRNQGEGRADQGRDPRSGQTDTLEPFDPCRVYRARFTKIVELMGLQREQATTFLCARLAVIPSLYQEQFVTGLESFAQAWSRAKPRGEDCDGASAANWYVEEFGARMAAEAEAHRARERANAARRDLLVPASAGVGGSLLFILLFLAFPLLIQIERNTRTA